MSRFANIQAALKDAGDRGIYTLVGAGGPLSGSSSRADVMPTGFNVAGYGCLYIDTTNGVMYWNEGDKLNLYWTPLGFHQMGLLSWFTDFRNTVGKAVSDTAAFVVIDSGIRIHGQGIAETDAGVTVAQTEGGAVASVITTDELVHLTALSVGASAATPFQPDTHGPITIDVLFAINSTLATKRMFCGFLGTSADALDPPVTGATTVLTLVQDDLAGLFYDSILTAGTELFAPHNKSDEAATLATTATGVDTGLTMTAAASYQRLRVEISAAGVMTCFKDKVQITQIAAALDVDEEVCPTFLIGSNTTATSAALVKKFAAWGSRGEA